MRKISRDFVRQLNQELDGSGDGQAIKDAMQEVRELRKELSDLRGEVNQATRGATQAGQQAFADVQNSIQPPALKSPKLPEEQNGAADATAVPKLPTPLEIPDDPE